MDFFAAPLTIHATGFSQWLMTNFFFFFKDRLFLAKNRRARLLPCQKFFKRSGKKPDPPKVETKSAKTG